MISYFLYNIICRTWLIRILLILVTVNFNARNSFWWKNNYVTKEGYKTLTLTCSHAVERHDLENSCSCIFLIFTNQLNFVFDSGVHPFLHPNSHHQIMLQVLRERLAY